MSSPASPGRGELPSTLAPAEDARAALGRTRRARLRDLLLASAEGLSLDQIERILEVRRGTILADLEHLRLSFRHQDATLFMVPPTCLQCGYVFRMETPKAPTKCPMCKRRSLSEPIFKAETGAA